MPATSLRKHSPPDTTARHRTLRRAMASASAKMPRRLCILSGGFLNERNFRGADMRRRQAAMQGASGATRPHMISSLRNHSPPDVMARHRTLRRAMASASAKMPRTWAHSAGFLPKKVCLFPILPPVVSALLWSQKKSQLFVSTGRHFLEMSSIRTRSREDLA